MEIKQFPNPDCRGFTIRGTDIAEETVIVIYKDSLTITQYWEDGADSDFICIDGDDFNVFMSGIEQCLKLLGDSPNKTVEELERQIDEVEK